MEKFIEILDSISVLSENLKKLGQKTYKLETIDKKLNEIKEFKEKLGVLEKTEANIDYIKLGEIKSEFKTLFYTTNSRLTELRNEIIQNTKDLNEQTSSQNTEENKETKITKMAEFDINTSLKVVPEFSGNYKELASFLKIIELINQSLSTEAKKTFIEFVREVKLSNKIKTHLGVLEPITTFEILKTELSKIYKSPMTIPDIYSKLNSFTQRNQNVTSYSDTILSLTAELSSLRISELEGTITTERRNDVITNDQKYALTIFKNNLNDIFRQPICVAQPKTLADAINLAKELERSTPSQGQVMFYNRGRYNNNRGHYNNSKQNYNYSRTNRQNTNTHNNNYNNNNYNRGNNSNVYRGNNAHGNYNNNFNRTQTQDVRNNSSNMQMQNNSYRGQSNRHNNFNRSRHGNNRNSTRGNRINVINEENCSDPEEGEVQH